MINLVPVAGLGNRIRVIASVYKYCKDNNLPLSIYWVREGGFNCSFSTLFNKIDDSNTHLNDHSWINHFIYGEPTIKNLYLPRFFDIIFSRKWARGIGNYEIDKIDLERINYILTFSQQQIEMYPINRLFVPTKEVQ